jgi:hypothetical protein
VPAGTSTWIFVFDTIAARGDLVVPKYTVTPCFMSRPSPTMCAIRIPRGITSSGWISLSRGAGASACEAGELVSLSQPSSAADMITTHNNRPMRISIALLAAVSACGDNLAESGFAGDYQMVAWVQQQGGCDGAGTLQTVPETDTWFRLADEELETGRLVGFFPCHELGSCNAVADLYRSFGDSPEGWSTVITSAIQPPCTLGYRRRTLGRIDALTIEIDETLQQAVDDTISGAACSLDEARARRDSLPCVEHSVWTGELRTP